MTPYYAHGEPARRPACMDDADMAAWNASNRRTHGASRADSPCRDCLEAFRRDMLAEGRCDGEPLSAGSLGARRMGGAIP